MNMIQAGTQIISNLTLSLLTNSTGLAYAKLALKQISQKFEIQIKRKEKEEVNKN